MNYLKSRKIGTEFLKYFIIIICTIIMLFPIYEMVSTSFKNQVDTFNIPPKWFFIPTFENYKAVLFENNFFRFFRNSLIVALCSTLLSVGIGALAAYPLARFIFPGKKQLTLSILILRMISPVILVVPIYLMFSTIGISFDGRLSLVLVYTALNLPFNIWVLTTFIKEVPLELEESALIDGCSDLKIFSKIILPLIAPGLSVASVFTFRISWNEFILSLVLTNRFSRTLPVAVSLFLTDTGVEWGKITAIATIISIPAFIFTFIAAKNLIGGITAGAVKG